MYKRQGQTFDRVDGNVIMVHLRTYCEMRINCAETLSLEKHKQLMALDGEDKYIISIVYKQDKRDKFPDDYILQDGKECILIQDRTKSTQFVFSEALSLRKFILKNYDLPERCEVKVVRPLPQTQSIIEFLKAKYPADMHTEIREDRLVELKAARKVIENNTELSDFEKRNKLNELYGFKQMTLDEFNAEQKELAGK